MVDEAHVGVRRRSGMPQTLRQPRVEGRSEVPERLPVTLVGYRIQSWVRVSNGSSDTIFHARSH